LPWIPDGLAFSFIMNKFSDNVTTITIPYLIFMTDTLTYQTKQRISSIDILGGLIMLVMALDHVRDFFHQGSPNPTDLSTTTPILFFTRWITHFCAPNFVFLSGISAFLAGQRRTKGELSAFLLKRGIWLVFIEVAIITFAFSLDVGYHFIVLQVIWAIGISMIILSALVWLPTPVIGIIGALIFFGHNIFDYVKTGGEAMGIFMTAGGFSGNSILHLGASRIVLDAYAVLPWTGVMLLGYCVGQLYQKDFDGAKRRKILSYISLGLFALFIVLRVINKYGDPLPWAQQKTLALTVISFFNVTKYPCSVIYLCMTLSAGTALLVVFERVNNWLTNIFVVYGSVPFFYYILHFYLIRIFTIIVFFAFGYTTNDIYKPGMQFAFVPQGFGFNLLGVYIVWLIVIGTLYLPCVWYSNYKNTHKHWWLSYL